MWNKKELVLEVKINLKSLKKWREYIQIGRGLPILF